LRLLDGLLDQRSIIDLHGHVITTLRQRPRLIRLAGRRTGFNQGLVVIYFIYHFALHIFRIFSLQFFSWIMVRTLVFFHDFMFFLPLFQFFNGPVLFVNSNYSVSATSKLTNLMNSSGLTVANCS